MHEAARAGEVARVTYADVVTAARILAGRAHRTPVLTSTMVDERTGARVFFKCENLQRAGAFKFRGAYNALRHLTSEQKARGVVTYSSGNHDEIAHASHTGACRLSSYSHRSTSARRIVAT